MVSEQVDYDVFRALADPTRRAILGMLTLGDQPVGEIAGHFPVTRPAISKHLRLLREADLVLETRVGRNRMYRLNAAPLKQVDDWLGDYRRMWQANLQSLKRFVETKERNG
jgi:DNA-binding transcriptional ArsR family regulator